MDSSPSEAHGLQLIQPSFKNILSIGISTGGKAELQMAALAPKSRILATTIDPVGAQAFIQELKECGLHERISVHIEDIAATKPDNEQKKFDFVYACLVLHYLSEAKLVVALSHIHGEMQPGALLYVVVRSDKCADARQPKNVYDPQTKLTTYEVASGGIFATRYFHSVTTISDALEAAGFLIVRVAEYDEPLSPNFDRSGTFVDNVLIEVIARRK